MVFLSFRSRFGTLVEMSLKILTLVEINMDHHWYWSDLVTTSICHAVNLSPSLGGVFWMDTKSLRANAWTEEEGGRRGAWGLRQGRLDRLVDYFIRMKNLCRGHDART